MAVSACLCDVRALRRQADRDRKRAARQQATESRRSHAACLCARPHLRMRISSQFIIGASLSEPHTSVTALRDAYVCLSVCLSVRGHIPQISI